MSASAFCKIRIDFVISTLNRGGAENKLVAVANGIDRSRYSVRVIVLKDGPLFDSLQVEREKGVIPSKYSLPGVFRLLGLFLKRRPDIVWAVGNGDAGFWGRILAWFSGTPVIIQSLHATERVGGKPTIDLPNKILDRLRVFTTRYVGVARGHVEYLVRSEGIDPDKIEHIYNGTDTDVFAPGKPDAALRRSLGIPEDKLVVGLVARFKPEKRHSLFLDAASILASGNKSLHFLLVGDGPLEDFVRSEVVRLNLTDKVHFAGGVDNVAPYYRLMSVCVLCSNTVEAFPNVVVEAMASGVPVVSTDVGSVNEAIVNGETGYLVPRDDPEALVGRINDMISDPETRDLMVKNAQRAVQEKFTLSTMILKREELFRGLLVSKNGRK